MSLFRWNAALSEMCECAGTVPVEILKRRCIELKLPK